MLDKGSVGEDRHSWSLTSVVFEQRGHICRKTSVLKDSNKKAPMRLHMPFRVHYLHEILICMLRQERHGRL